MEILPCARKVCIADAGRITVSRNGVQMGLGSRATRSVAESGLAKGRDESSIGPVTPIKAVMNDNAISSQLGEKEFLLFCGLQGQGRILAGRAVSVA